MALILTFWPGKRRQRNPFMLRKRARKSRKQKERRSHHIQACANHGGIKWNDPDNENRLVISHATKTHCKRERKIKDMSNYTGHYFLATSDGCEMDISDPE